MTSSAKLAHGTKFQRAGVSVLEVTKIGDIEIQTDSQDVTNADSAGWRESIPALMSMKDLTIEGNLRLDDSTGQMALASDQIAQTINTYGVVGPATLAFAWTFSGWVKSFKTQQPQDGVAKFVSTIEITGNSSLTYTASSNLTALAISVGSLSPAFSATQYDYADALTGGTASVTVTATNASAQVLKLYVNGVYTQTLTSGVASSAISTAIGVTKIQVYTQDSGKVGKWYTIWAARTS